MLEQAEDRNSGTSPEKAVDRHEITPSWQLACTSMPYSSSPTTLAWGLAGIQEQISQILSYVRELENFWFQFSYGYSASRQEGVPRQV